MTFRGSPQNPTKEVVELTTAPTAGTATHWGQQSDTQSTWRPITYYLMSESSPRLGFGSVL